MLLYMPKLQIMSEGIEILSSINAFYASNKDHEQGC